MRRCRAAPPFPRVSGLPIVRDPLDCARCRIVLDAHVNFLLITFVAVTVPTPNPSWAPCNASTSPAAATARPTASQPGMQEAKYGEALSARELSFFSQFEGAEIVAETYGVTRAEMDEFAVASHKKAAAATKAGRFDAEIIPLQGQDKEGNPVVHQADEGIRANTSLEGLARLKPLKELRSGGASTGLITAGLSSQICDGAAALLLCNERGLQKLGLRPRARIVSLAVCGADPVAMLAAPIPATRQALSRAGLTIEDMDLYEVNEAFASVPLAWAKELHADLDRLNVNGGAMALGHPLGGTGAKLMTTLVHELERRGGRYGLQAICEGGGTANATIIERLPPTARL